MNKITLSVMAVLAVLSLSAQPPQAFKYQAVARNVSGEILSNQNVSFRISILEGSTTGPAVYVETHDTLTNVFGLVNLEIGNGTVVSGDFGIIKWGATTYFLQIEMDDTGGDNYQLIGCYQLMSVPYSINSGSLTLKSPGGEFYDVTVDDNGDLITVKSCPPTVTDFEGNVYNTVQIGTQCWMKENLKTTSYQNGTPIPNVTDASNWYNLSSGAYVWYNNNISWKDIYGALYNWYAVIDVNVLCPAGWHVPTDAEWLVLIDYLGGESIAGGKMKEAGFEHWKSPNTGATNESGFTGLPSGYRYMSGSFFSITYTTYFWSSTQNGSNAYSRGLNYDLEYIFQNNSEMRNGFSVRCLKD